MFCSLDYHCIAHCLGVGGIEAEAVMLGQSISMVLPQVVGYKITGKLGQLTTSTDVVLTITKVRISVDHKYRMYFNKSDMINYNSLVTSFL